MCIGQGLHYIVWIQNYDSLCIVFNVLNSAEFHRGQLEIRNTTFFKMLFP